MRDVNGGVMLRYLHANGASLFFLAVYLHIFRGLYYGSYKAPREVTWIIGMLIYLAMMATGFMGYVLPWGQMSFWGAQVIISLFGAIPIIGEDIDEDRHAVGCVTLVGDLFIGNTFKFTRAALDGSFNIVLGHILSFCLEYSRSEPGFASASPPPIREATVISLIILVNILPLFASMAPFLCFILAHLLWPDIHVSL